MEKISLLQQGYDRIIMIMMIVVARTRHTRTKYNKEHHDHVHHDEDDDNNFHSLYLSFQMVRCGALLSVVGPQRQRHTVTVAAGWLAAATNFIHKYTQLQFFHIPPKL